MSMRCFIGLSIALGSLSVLPALAQQHPPKLIDVHVHYNGEPGMLPKLLAKLDAQDGMAFLLVTPQGLSAGN